MAVQFGDPCEGIRLGETTESELLRAGVLAADELDPGEWETERGCDRRPRRLVGPAVDGRGRHAQLQRVAVPPGKFRLPGPGHDAHREHDAAVNGPDDVVPAVAYTYTHTVVPSGRMLFAQIQFIASSVTRTHPCDAGYGGTLPDPWIA